MKERNYSNKERLLESIKNNIRRLKLISKYVDGKTLDIGFASCPNIYLLDPIGIDVCLPIERFNYKYTIAADAYNIPFKDNTFDTIVFSEIIEHLENPTRALKEIYRVLKNNGRLIITTPNVYYYSTILNYIILSKKVPAFSEHISEMPFYTIEKLLYENGFKLKFRKGTSITLPIISRASRTKADIRMPLAILSKSILFVATKSLSDSK